MPRRLLLVGWDAADWQIIDPLMARGEMPHLAGLIANGVRGNLATIYPPLSPMLWTTIATGKRPPEHGILGFTEPSEDGLFVHPISNLGRKTKALWNILNQNGKRSIVVGWWPSHPAEPIRGAMVSEHFKLFPGQDLSSPLQPGTIWPPAWAGRMADLRVCPMEITGEILQLFVPEFQRVDQSKDRTLHDLAEIIAESMSIHAAATELLESEAWDFAAVYHCGIDHFSHRFMRYHAGKTVRAFDTDPRIYQGIVANAYRYHDLMLGRMLSAAGASLSLAYVRHSREYDPRREEIGVHDADRRLEQGALWLGDEAIKRHVVVNPSTGVGLADLAASEGATAILFGSDYRTPPGRVELNSSSMESSCRWLRREVRCAPTCGQSSSSAVTKYASNLRFLEGWLGS